MFKKKFYLLGSVLAALLTVIGGSSELAAQSRPFPAQFAFIDNFNNPASVGRLSQFSATLGHQWGFSNVAGAPQTSVVSVQWGIPGKNMGLGVNAYIDRLGDTQQLFSGLSYSYSLDTRFGKLALGLQANVEQYSSNFSSPSSGIIDPAFVNFNETKVNMGFGMMFYNESGYLGISSPDILEYNIGGSAINRTTNTRYYVFEGAYGLPISSSWAVRIAAQGIYSVGRTLQAAVYPGFIYKGRILMGVGYGLNRFISLNTEVLINKNLAFAYNYNYYTASQAALGSGHEIALKYRVGLNYIAKYIPCPSFLKGNKNTSSRYSKKRSGSFRDWKGVDKY